jgi:hypothetical protein
MQKRLRNKSKSPKLLLNNNTCQPVKYVYKLMRKKKIILFLHVIAKAIAVLFIFNAFVNGSTAKSKNKLWAW